MPDKPGGLTIGAFAAATLIGGGNFLAVRFSNRELPPFWGAGLRFSVASVLFIVAAGLLRLRWPRGKDLWLTIVYGLLSFAVTYALMYWALVRVTAGVATVVLAVVPLTTLLLATLQGTERLGGRALTGAALALAGILWMTFGPGGREVPVGPLLAMLAAAVVTGESVILGKRLSASHPVMTNAVAMPAGTVILLALSQVTGERWALPQTTEAAASVIYLSTVGSIGLFVLVLLVVRRWTASAASYVFVLFPIVTLVLGALIADEPITAYAVTGAVLVMAGVWFGALSPGARRSA